MTTILHAVATVWPVIAAAGLAGLALIAGIRTVRRIRLAVRARRQEPAHTGHPVEHVGATENFGRELRALRNVKVSPELVSDIETELRWGLIWHEFEAALQAEVDRIFAPALVFAEPANFDEVRELVAA